MWSKLLLLLSCYFPEIIAKSNDVKEETNIQNVEVSRLIDITTFIVKDKYKITIKNIGTKPVEYYRFLHKDGTAFVTFTNSENQTLTHSTEVDINSTIYVVKLAQPLQTNQDYKLTVKLIYPSRLVPATKFSRYNEEHSFMWKGNTLCYSKYFTVNYRLMFLTDPLFNRHIDASLIYDSYVNNKIIYYAQNIKACSHKEMVLTFTSLLPMLKVKRLERNIYVSHFGKIMVEDNVVVQNGGPKLIGPYFNYLKSESDYWMYTHLPPSAENIELLDVLGKNSRRFIHENEGTKTLKFIPRYSLLQGGWKSSYTLQYHVPIYEHLYRDDRAYYLRIRALDHILNDVVVEDVDVKIFLPDGASIISVLIPSGFDRQDYINTYTSLTVIGRKTVHLKGKLLLEEHIDDVIVVYLYSFSYILVAPFFIILLLESVFFVVMVWIRCSRKLSLEK